MERTIRITAKKSLGQHFLKSQSALKSIIAEAKISPDDIVLEVGPGKGVLTEKILATGAKVVAIEKDERLIELLKEKFSTEIQAGKLILVNEDILSFDPSVYQLLTTDYILVANLPYYITGQFLRTFLGGGFQPSRMVLLLQKEVAKRIVAQNKKESILSISVKAYGTPHYIETVKAKYFSPPPQVDSAVISIENINRDFFKNIDEKKFFTLVKAGFAHKRKKLVGNLVTVFGNDAREAFLQTGLDENIRAEDVPLEKWLEISRLNLD